MGSYYFRPDGLAVVTQDDGSVTPPLAIDELELEDAGHTPAPPPQRGLPPGALAANGQGAPPTSRLDAGGGLGAPPAGLPPEALAAMQGNMRPPDRTPDSPKRPFEAIVSAPSRVAPAEPFNPNPKNPDATTAKVQAQSDANRRAFLTGEIGREEFHRREGMLPTVVSAEEAASREQAPAPGAVDPKRLRRVGGGAPGAADPASMAPRPMLVKGGMRLQSAVKQPGVEISPEVKGELLDDRRPEQYAESAGRIAEQRDALSLEREQMALDQQRDIDQQMVQRQAIDRKLAEQSKAIQKRERDLERMEPQSVREYWADRGSLARLGAIFTAAVGGYLQGMTGASRNSGLDQINELVSFDLAKQQDAYERGRDRRDSAKNEYAEALQLYGTPEAAALDFEMRRYAAAERLLAARAEKVGTEEYRQQAAQLTQELRTARAQKRMELEQLEKGRFLQENWLNEPDRYVGGAPKPKEEQVAMLADRMEKAGLGEKEEQLGAVADLISELPEGELPTSETRNLLSRGVRGAADLIGGQGTGRELLDSPAERRAVAKVEQIKGKLRHELSGAAVSPQEQERLDAQLDQINTREGLERFRTDLQRKMERRKAGIRAGVAPEAVLEYERRRGAYNLPERPRSQRVDDQ